MLAGRTCAAKLHVTRAAVPDSDLIEVIQRSDFDTVGGVTNWNLLLTGERV